MSKTIQVAAAVIFDDKGRIFLAKRLKNAHQGGLWEFPGGKIEADEVPVDALKRELAEELGIEVVSAEPFISIAFDYPDKAVVLDVFTVSEFQGEPWGREGQQTSWFELQQLATLDFPAANLKILEKLQLTYSK